MAADAIRVLYSCDAAVVSDDVAALRQPATLFVRNNRKCATPQRFSVLRVKYDSNRGADASIILIGKDSIKNNEIEITS